MASGMRLPRNGLKGFSMKRYGYLFDTVKITPVDWWDDLLWRAATSLPSFALDQLPRGMANSPYADRPTLTARADVNAEDL